mmetsp:Transcript_44624/g.105717  ORF Transcript_44624/g.105717 Transcript_44624/m.105717 type:complete len:393 (-) Transcript_44624:89-1267(-)
MMSVDYNDVVCAWLQRANGATNMLQTYPSSGQLIANTALLSAHSQPLMNPALCSAGMTPAHRPPAAFGQLPLHFNTAPVVFPTSMQWNSLLQPPELPLNLKLPANVDPSKQNGANFVETLNLQDLKPFSATPDPITAANCLTYAKMMNNQLQASTTPTEKKPAYKTYLCSLCSSVVVDASPDAEDGAMQVCHACKDQLIREAADRNRTRLSKIMEAWPEGAASSPGSESTASPTEGSPTSRLRAPKDPCGSQLCEHKRRRNRCKDCGGSQICAHGRLRSNCKECGGSQFCEHNRRRNRCKECGGSQICEHKRRRSRCKDCSRTCRHKVVKSECAECADSSAHSSSAPSPCSTSAASSVKIEEPGRISIDNLISATQTAVSTPTEELDARTSW